MKPVTAAGIYARISLDAEGEGKGVKRQLADCHDLANRLGWPVTDEYVDNDVSAYSGKTRPQYERLLADISTGAIDAVLIYNPDRLTRRPAEFEVFQETCTNAGMTQVRFVTGDFDIGSDDGLLMGRVYAAFAAKESAAKSRRQKRKNDEKAAAGIPHVGSNRPYGFEPDGVTHRADDIAVIRQLVDRFLAGESLRSLATWLDTEDIRTVEGGPWRTMVVKQMLCSARLAGLLVHRGEIVGPGKWQPVIPEATWRKVLAEFERRKVSGRRAPRRYLLSGLLRCGRCDNKLFSAPRNTVRRYVCVSGPDHGGCGHLTVVAPPLEKLVAHAVLYRLDTSELADALAGRIGADDETSELRSHLSADRDQLDELAASYAQKAITMPEWLKARSLIEARMTTTQRRLRRLTDADALEGLVGEGSTLRRQWPTLTLNRQVAIVQGVLDHGVILPGARGARSLDPDRVKPVWRL
ncbi:MAG: recombinase family protein [Acidimicrobiales bacterium]